MTSLGAGQSALLATRVARLLSEAGIEYAVIGAMAAAVHGVVRASVDADLLAATSVARARDLVTLFQANGLNADLRLGDTTDPIRALVAVSDKIGNRVDLLIGLRGVEAGLFQRARPVRLLDTDLQIVGLEDFIAMKAFAGGPVDLLDARRAIESAGANLDSTLVRRLARQFGPEAATVVEGLLGATGRR